MKETTGSATRGVGDDRSRGFWGAFFDPSFASSIADTVIRVVWTLAVALTGIGMLWAVIALFTQSPYFGPIEVAVLLVGGPINLFVLRLVLEVAKAVLQMRDVTLARHGDGEF